MPSAEEATKTIHVTVASVTFPRRAATRVACSTSVTATTISAKATQTETSDTVTLRGSVKPSLSSLPVANARGNVTNPTTAQAPAARERNHQLIAPPTSIAGTHTKIQRTTGPTTTPEASNTVSTHRVSDIAAIPARTSDTAGGRSRRVAQHNASATTPAMPNKATIPHRLANQVNASVSSPNSTSAPPPYASASAVRDPSASAGGAGSASTERRCASSSSRSKAAPASRAGDSSVGFAVIDRPPLPRRDAHEPTQVFKSASSGPPKLSDVGQL